MLNFKSRMTVREKPRSQARLFSYATSFQNFGFRFNSNID